MSRRPLLLFITLASLTLFAASFCLNSTTQYVNPTGTYSLVSKVKVRHGETFGITGNIQIKTLSKNRVAIVLGVDNGAPAYHSGTLIDTLSYKNNTCIYKRDKYDPSCRISFIITRSGITVTQRQADLNSGCGFGQGVFADGFYKKKSGKVPILKNPQTGELIR